MNIKLKDINMNTTFEGENSIIITIGGIIGSAINTKIISCSFDGEMKFTASVRGKYEQSVSVSVGGLVGSSDKTTSIKNCFAVGKVESNAKTPYSNKNDYPSQRSVALGIGNNVSFSYSLVNTVATVQTDRTIDQFTTYGAGPIGTIKENCFYFSDLLIIGKEKIIFGNAVSDNALKIKSTYLGWDFENIWQIEPGNYPTLRVFKPTIGFTSGIEDITCENGDMINIPIKTDNPFAEVSCVSKPEWLELENGVLTGICPKENKTYAVSLKATALYYKDTMAEFTIEVKVPRYNVSISKTEGGTVSGMQGDTAEKGDCLHLTIIPDEGYVIKTVLVDGTSDESAVNDGKLLLNDIRGDKSVVVTFERIVFTITLCRNGGGYDNAEETIDIPYGSDRTLSFAPNYGYMIKNVKINGQTESEATNGEYLLRNVKENILIEIHYDDAVYRITATTKKGDVSDTLMHEVKHGKSKDFHLAPETGYYLKELFVDGIRFSTAGVSYLFDDVRSDRAIEIIFERIMFMIHIEFRIDGETENKDAVKIYFGENYDLGIGRKGYLISGITVDGRTNHDALSTGHLSLENIQSDKQVIISYQTLKEDFTAITYTFYALDIITALALIYIARLYLRIRMR